MPGHEQRHLFDRFYRADGGKAFGSGLGLAIARELAVRMGWDDRAALRPGETRSLLLGHVPSRFSRTRASEWSPAENGARKVADLERTPS